jgi:hypothetical protein
MKKPGPRRTGCRASNLLTVVASKGSFQERGCPFQPLRTKHPDGLPGFMLCRRAKRHQAVFPRTRLGGSPRTERKRLGPASHYPPSSHGPCRSLPARSEQAGRDHQSGCGTAGPIADDGRACRRRRTSRCDHKLAISSCTESLATPLPGTPRVFVPSALRLCEDWVR